MTEREDPNVQMPYLDNTWQNTPNLMCIHVHLVGTHLVDLFLHLGTHWPDSAVRNHQVSCVLSQLNFHNYSSQIPSYIHLLLQQDAVEEQDPSSAALLVRLRSRAPVISTTEIPVAFLCNISNYYYTQSWRTVFAREK